jgi:hypothetical protein
VWGVDDRAQLLELPTRHQPFDEPGSRACAEAVVAGVLAHAIQPTLTSIGMAIAASMSEYRSTSA